MKLSVVILNYNVHYFLEQCILAAQRALISLEGEIIVVDNNSEDDSCAMVRDRFPDVLLIENTKNIGFSKANNQAVTHAKGEYVCILNPDTAVSEDVFTTLLTYVDTQKAIGAVGTRLIDGTGHFLPESKRNVPYPRVALSRLLGRKEKSRYYAHEVHNETNAPVDVLVGAFMLMKRELFMEVGGFDEDYFMYGEDIDLSYKIGKAGYQNHYCGAISVLHYKGESTNRDEAYLNRFYGAMRIFYKKHFARTLLSSVMISVGITLAKWMRQSNNAFAIQSKPSKAVVVTENIGLLQQLSEKLDIPFRTLSKARISEGSIADTLIIFDAEYASYTQIHRIMEQLKGHNNCFRIRPPGCNFILGSDHSDQKGSVMVF